MFLGAGHDGLPLLLPQPVGHKPGLSALPHF